MRPEWLRGNLLETYILSLVLLPHSYSYKLTTVKAAFRGHVENGRRRGKRRRGAKFLLLSVSYWGSYLRLVNCISSKPLFLTSLVQQNSLLHFLCNRRYLTLQVESKGRKAIASVLVIKWICIMNHMPKGPVLHVGQIFVWIFNFYIQMKHSV